MEEEEIYDDGISPVATSGLSALRSKFEKPTPAANKPSISSKPVLSPKSVNIAAKFGGLQPSGAKSIQGPGVTNKFKADVSAASKSEPVTSNTSDSNVRDKTGTGTGAPSLTKRNSKLNIPAAFQNAEPPPPFDKPKPELKPVPKWKQKQDDTNNNKETVENSNVSNELTTMLNKESKSNGLPKKQVLSPTPSVTTPSGNVKEKANLLFGSASPSALKASLKPVSDKSHEKDKPEAQIKPITPKRIGSAAGSTPVELRSKFGPQVKTKRKSVKSIVRSKDSKRFHKVEVEDIKSDSEVPSKPDKLDTDIDWDKLAIDFKNSVKDLETSGEKSGFEEVEEEDYDDVANVMRPNTRAVSIIQPMTEEEEKEWADQGFEGLVDDVDSLPPPPAENLGPQEEYDDVGVLIQNGENGDGEELYEPLPDEPLDEPPPRPSKSSVVQNGTSGKPPPPPPVDHIDKKDSKELEKERKRREKEEKELSKKKEKEFRKKQDDLKQLMHKYKIDAAGLTQSVGKGSIRKSMKGGKKDIAVQQGEKVDIIRMVDNDKGKWLIRIVNTDKVGYVDATNVEVDTNIIRDLMKHTGEGDDEGETYEAVEGEVTPEPIEEEIYEECN